MFQNDFSGLSPLPELPEQQSGLAPTGYDPRLVQMTQMAMDLDIPVSVDSSNAIANVNPQLSQQQQQQQLATPSSRSDGQLGQQPMTGAGAGPLPTGFGSQPQNPGSALTEFTKRRNWSQRVVEELRDFLHILTPDGRLLYLSPSCKSLTGYEPHQLQGRLITDFIHQDDSAVFVREFNESIASGNPLRFFYRFRKEDGEYMIFEAHGHPHLSSEAASFGNNNLAPLCRGFFMMSRPYPTKNAHFLDSFLEHKIENERLMRKIAELKREEAEDNEAQERYWAQKDVYEGGSIVSSEQVRTTDGSLPSSMPFGGMPPPSKPTTSNTALTSQNLHDATAGYKPDSINDKMARYEGATHIETIEMLTGLHYREGERSFGISTGDTSPALIRGDAGIAINADRDRRDGEKKKKLKVADEYVCTDCGTLDSPEWRKGPNGPKTLCNACGLRWAKKEKKRQSLSHSVNAGGSSGQQPPGMAMAGTPQ